MPPRRREDRPPKTHRAITLRLTLSDRVALGPGKADLLEAIRDTGSIAAAGRRMGMSYQRAHDLVSALNEDFEAPLIEATAGGTRGGGAQLTPLGDSILAAYRSVEAEALAATATRLEWLRGRLKQAQAPAKLVKRRKV
jgi:molybdate transport system regulatory protein